MEIGFQTEQSVLIIIDGQISEVSVRWRSTVCGVLLIGIIVCDFILPYNQLATLMFYAKHYMLKYTSISPVAD